MVVPDKRKPPFRTAFTLNTFEQKLNSITLSLRQIKTGKSRPFAMAGSEVFTIMTCFHFGSFRNLKHFYPY